MSDFNSIYQQGLYLSPEQQNLFMTALNSNNTSQKSFDTQKVTQNRSRTQSSSNNTTPSHSNGFDPASSTSFESPLLQDIPGSGQLGFGIEESPFLDFDPDVDFDFQGTDQLIGDLPGFDTPESGDKRKSFDGDDDASNGKKRRESDDKDKSAKKPGRKPLTSEPTTVRVQQLLAIYIRTDLCRNEKPRIALHNVPSVSAKRNISKILKPRSMNLRRHHRLPIKRTGSFELKSNGYK